MRIGELLAGLRELTKAYPGDAALAKAVKTLEGRVSGHEGMSVLDFVRRLQQDSANAATSPPSDVCDEIVGTLQSALPNDDAFHSAIARIEKRREATKAVLTDVYYRLFKRRSGVPAKATRAEILRLITDERQVLVRNEKMGQLLGGRPVPAE